MCNSNVTVQEKILSLERGSIFFPSDFEGLASDTAVRQTLSRMVKRGEIIRLTRGIYCLPRSNPSLGLDVIPPSVEEIAQRIAERDKVKIIPTGDHALNQLGLSSQVPVNAVYITNGARKKIRLGEGRNIVFRESNEFRLFEFKSKIMMLVISAMRSIGKDNLLDNIMTIIRNIVNKETPEIYRHDLKLAPAWVRKKLEENRGIGQKSE